MVCYSRDAIGRKIAKSLILYRTTLTGPNPKVDVDKLKCSESSQKPRSVTVLGKTLVSCFGSCHGFIRGFVEFQSVRSRGQDPTYSAFAHHCPLSSFCFSSRPNLTKGSFADWERYSGSRPKRRFFRTQPGSNRGPVCPRLLTEIVTTRLRPKSL